MIGQFSLFAVLAVALVAEVVNAWEPAAIGEFPYQVSLNIRGRHACGGAIIGERHIVTTAKCVMDLPAMSDLHVVTGSLSSIDGGESYSPRKIVSHPDFKRGTTGPDDIAIIALEKVINLNATQKQLYLPWQRTPTGIDAILTGWRWALIATRTDMKDLMKLTVTTKACPEHKLVELKDICASVRSGSSECLPDNGAPLVQDGTLIGVLSYGNACDEEASAVFTNVVYYMNWIFDTVKAS